MASVQRGAGWSPRAGLTLAISGVRKLMIFPNSFAWKTDFTLSFKMKDKSTDQQLIPRSKTVVKPTAGLYFGFNAKSAALYNHRVLGELFKQVLPLTGELAKRTFGHKKDPTGSKQRNISTHLRVNARLPSYPRLSRFQDTHRLVIMRMSDSLTFAWAKYLYLA